MTAEDTEEYYGEVTAVILCEGDAIGSVILLSRDPKYRNGNTGAEAGAHGRRISGQADGELSRPDCSAEKWEDVYD